MFGPQQERHVHHCIRMTKTPTLAQRLLGLRTTTGICIAGAAADAICGATGCPALFTSFIRPMMTQAAAYGINRLSSAADKSADTLQREADELQRGLSNADVHRLMGRAIALALRVHAEDNKTNAGLRPVLTKLAAAVDKQWLDRDEGTLPPALQECKVSDYFNGAPEEIEAQPVLDAAMWRSELEPIAERGAAQLSDDEWPQIGAVLTVRYPRALYAVTKTAAIDGDPAWPGLLLRLLAEQRKLMEFAKHEITQTSLQIAKNTERLQDLKDQLADMKAALAEFAKGSAQLDDILFARIHQLIRDKDKRDDARYQSLFALVQRESQRMRDAISFVWTLAERTPKAQTDLQNNFTSLLALLDAHAPNLTLPDKNLDKQRDRFVYKTERLKVVGREAELAELNAWLDKTQHAPGNPAGFGWDLWVGPPGSGKSRLALQLCRDRQNWHCGFFSFKDPHQPDWLLWQPKANTLIIFDYVAEHADKIGRIISTLTSRAALGAKHPLPQGINVRCLLLERAALREKGEEAAAAPASTHGNATATELEAPWLATLRGAATDSGQDVRTTYERGDMASAGRYIGGVSAEAAHAIVREEAALAEERTTEEQFVQRLDSVKRIDQHFRPLFIAMAAESHREREDIADFTQLVEYIRNKEWKHALERLHAHSSSHSASDEAWAKLVCLATMCEGLQDDPAEGGNKLLTDTLAHSADLGLPDDNQYDDGSHYALLVSGANGRDAPKLEPDIVGEAMVLHTLARLPRQRAALIKAAWQLGMDRFVARCAQNFPFETEASDLLVPTPDAWPDALAAAHTALGNREYKQGDIDAVRNRGRRLFNDSSQPLRVRSVGAFFLMHGKPTAEELTQFEAEATTSLTSDTLENVYSLALVVALYYAFTYSTANSEQADAFLSRLRALAAFEHAAPLTRVILAESLFNAFNNAPRNTERAKCFLGYLRDLYQANSNMPEVSQKFGQALTNSISFSSKDYPLADGFLSEWRVVVAAPNANQELREDFARGLFNAFNNSVPDSMRARYMLSELYGVARANDATPVIREFMARALLKTFCWLAQNDKRIHGILGELRTLADSSDATTTLRELFAIALPKAILATRNDNARIDNLLSDLQAICTRSDASPALREDHTIGLCNALMNAESNSTRADGFLAQLRSMALAADATPVMREALAHGLFNLRIRSRADSAKSDEYWSEIQRLNTASSTGLDIARATWARCCQLIFESLEVGIPSPAHLVTLGATLPPLLNDQEVRKVTFVLMLRVKSLINTVEDHLRGELTEAMAVLEMSFGATFGWEIPFFGHEASRIEDGKESLGPDRRATE